MLEILMYLMFYHLTVSFVVIYYDNIKVVLRHFFLAMHNLAAHPETKFFVLSMARLAINTGAGVASVSVVGYFIPPLEVASATLVIVGIFGIILALSGYYIERALQK